MGAAAKTQVRAKASLAAQVGVRVVKLNREANWPTNRGLDVKAFALLRGLPPSRAMQIIEELEAQAESVSNPCDFVQKHPLAKKSLSNAVKRPAPLPAPPPKKP